MLLHAEYDDGAVAVLEEIVDYDKRNVDALRMLGHLWSKMEDPEKAIEYWEKVKMIRPEDKEAAKAVRDL